MGFEPTHPKILRPERSALDHSAKTAFLFDIWLLFSFEQEEEKKKKRAKKSVREK